MDSSRAIHVLMFLLFLVSPIQTVNNLQIIFTDQTHHIEIGAEVRLSCVVIGGNNPHVTWISPKGQLPLNAMTEHNGQTLIISGFDTEDIGQYICVASDGLQFANHVFSVALSSTTTIKHTTEETSTTIRATTPMTTRQQATTQKQYVTTLRRVTTPKHDLTTSTEQVTTRVFATLPTKTTSELPSTSSLPTTTQTHPTSQITTLQNTHSPVQSTGLDCMMCNDVLSPAFCTNSIKCGTHEECYLQRFLRDGRVLYMQGCMNKFACSSIQSPAPAEMFGRRRQSDGVVLCESCCSDYSGCNLGGLCNTPGVPPKILDISVSPSRIHLGDNVEVKCNALGVPKPSIQWGVMASSYPDNLRFVQGESFLKILNFNPNDEHIYRCTAENINGRDTKDVALRIN